MIAHVKVTFGILFLVSIEVKNESIRSARVFGRSVVRPSGSRSLIAAESLVLRSCAVAQSKRGAQGVQGSNLGCVKNGIF